MADAPLQIMPSLAVVPEVSVAAMAGVGLAFTVNDGEVAATVQPLLLVTVTV